MHRSHYPLDWLRAHCYSRTARAARLHQPTHWNARIVDNLPAVAFDDAFDDAGCLALCRKLRDYGFVVVRGGPANGSGIEQVANLIGEIADT
eukprot:UN15844